MRRPPPPAPFRPRPADRERRGAQGRAADGGPHRGHGCVVLPGWRFQWSPPPHSHPRLGTPSPRLSPGSNTNRSPRCHARLRFLAPPVSPAARRRRRDQSLRQQRRLQRSSWRTSLGCPQPRARRGRRCEQRPGGARGARLAAGAAARGRVQRVCRVGLRVQRHFRRAQQRDGVGALPPPCDAALRRGPAAAASP